MPCRQVAEKPIDTNLCHRCQTFQPVIKTRGQSLCSECFCKYVSTKVVKRMELSFRVRDSTPGHQPELLVPFSFGPCSNALLHVLSQHLRGQSQKSGRTGYQLHVLHVDYQGSMDYRLWDKLQLRYPEHAYSCCQLEDVVDDQDLSPLLTDRTSQNSASAVIGDDENRLSAHLSALPSTTARADVFQLLRHRRVIQFAKEHNCDAILWAHSTTALAARTLAETAKGRGFALPWLVGDGESPLGVPSHYPLREILSKEVVAFASHAEPSYEDLVLKEDSKPAVSTKNTTIDDLMEQYFTNVEAEYPSIVANVVRTTGKLQSPSLDQIEKHCELCNLPLQGQAPERSRLCYGCIRNMPTPVE